MVAGAGAPPDADTRERPPLPLAYRIVPSGAHVPPKTSVKLSTTTWAPPPAAGIFLNCFGEKNAIQRLSGDQKGSIAFSVPAKACGAGSASGRTQSSGLPRSTLAVKAIAEPSGESANCGTGTEVLRGSEKTPLAGG